MFCDICFFVTDPLPLFSVQKIFLSPQYETSGYKTEKPHNICLNKKQTSLVFLFCNRTHRLQILSPVSFILLQQQKRNLTPVHIANGSHPRRNPRTLRLSGHRPLQTPPRLQPVLRRSSKKIFSDSRNVRLILNKVRNVHNP